MGGLGFCFCSGIGLGVWVFKDAAAAAAKSHQPCLNLCDPIEGSPPGSSIHGIFQERVLKWGSIVFSVNRTRLGLYPGITKF